MHGWTLHRRGATVTEQGDLDHERVANGILSRIASGEYEVGKLIPSTKQLEQQYRVSQTTARKAVVRLQGEGVLEGRPGKGVAVRAMPDEAALETRDLKALAETVAELKRRTEGYAELEKTVSRLEDNLRNLYARQAFIYPDSEQDSDKRQDRRVGHG